MTMATEMDVKSIEIKVEGRGSCRWADLREIAGWGRLPRECAVVALTSHGRVTCCWPIDPVGSPVVHLPDGSWVAGDIRDFLAIVGRVEAGEGPASIYAQW